MGGFTKPTYLILFVILAVGIGSATAMTMITVAGNFTVIGDTFLEGDLSVGIDEPSDDDSIFFDDGTKIQRWDDSVDRFEFSEDLGIDGVLAAGIDTEGMAQVHTDYHRFGQGLTSNGLADANDVMVNGYLEVNSDSFFDGDLTCNGCIDATDLSVPTLGELSCSPNQVARWNGVGWICSEISLSLNTLILDSSGDVGLNTSLELVNGKPAISYYDITNEDLKYLQATNADGTSWNTPVIVDSTGNVGGFSSLAVVNGKPAISYYDSTNEDLKYVQATNADGTSWNTPVTVDSTGNVGVLPSLTVVNGNPAVSYYDATNDDLLYVQATNADGTSWNTPVIVDSAGDVGLYNSLAVVNGKPAISYEDRTNDDLLYVQATNADGTSWNAPVIVDSAGDVGAFNSLAVVNGKPAISYWAGASGGLKYAQSSDSDGMFWNTPITIDNSGGNFNGQNTSLKIVNGKPAISYHDESNGDLRFVLGSDANGESWYAPIIIDSAGDVGAFTSLEIINGKPAISYYDATDGDLRYVLSADTEGRHWLGINYN